MKARSIKRMIEREIPVNEVFDVLTWASAHLTTEVYDNVKGSHDGKHGEKVQKALLKCQNKDELLKWHNRTFEIGLMEDSRRLFKFNPHVTTDTFTRGGDPYKKMGLGSHRKVDKHGNPLKIGSSVNVNHKPHNYFKFTGTVYDFEDDYIIVVDQFDDYYSIYPKDLEVNEAEYGRQVHRIRALKVIQNFTRGGDPYKKLSIGEEQYTVDTIFRETKDSYIRSRYPDREWTEIIKFLLSKTRNKDSIVDIMLSKHIRWSSYEGTTAEKFIRYYDKNNGMIQDDLLHEAEAFTRGGDPYKKLGVGSHRKKVDKHGDQVEIGSIVNVDGKSHDRWEFRGVVNGFRNEYVIVVDQSGDYFEVEPKEIELNETEGFTRRDDPYRKLGVGSNKRIGT